MKFYGTFFKHSFDIFLAFTLIFDPIDIRKHSMYFSHTKLFKLVNN